MWSALRVVAPAALKLSSQSHQLAHPPAGKRVTFTAVLADTSNPSTGQPTPSHHPLPLALCPFKVIQPLKIDAQPLPFPSRQLLVCGTGNDTQDNSTANPDTPPEFVTDPSDLAPTTRPPSFIFPVFGPFDILYCIQSGGFGAAWAARDQSTGRLLCLKVFQSLKNPDTRRSVQTELGIFRHMAESKGGERGRQFIIELNRSIQHNSTVFFALELMTIDLGTFLYNEPERCKMHARRWTAQIALGIESLHEMGILHRDIKPDNVLIDSRENVRIIDFGLACMDSTGEPLYQGVGYATDFLGTTSYMAPEVLRNGGRPAHRRRRYGTAVDWWALGCIVFELESRDHQILFDTEDDVHTYIGWNQNPYQFEERYPRFEGLDPVVVDLLEGLLHVHYSARYTLSDLEKHDYFLLCNGSEFDNAAVRALERPVCPELEPQFAGDHGPITVIKAATLSSIYDWMNLKWAAPGE